MWWLPTILGLFRASNPTSLVVSVISDILLVSDFISYWFEFSSKSAFLVATCLGFGKFEFMSQSPLVLISFSSCSTDSCFIGELILGALVLSIVSGTFY